MIIEKIRQKKQPLGIDPTMAKYFYFSEAPDDGTNSESNEDSEEVSAEAKPIKIRKPRVNYAKDIPSTDDDELPPPPGEETPTPEGDAAAIAEDDPPEPVTVDADDIAADDELPPPPGEEAPVEEPEPTSTDEPSDDESVPPPPAEEDAEQPAEANETDDLPPPPGEEAPAEEPASVDEPSENDDNLPPPPGEGGSGDAVSVDTPTDGDESELPPPPAETSDADDTPPPGEGGTESPADGESSEDLPPPPGEEGDDGEEIDDELGLLEDEDPEDPTDASGPTRKYNLYRDFLALYNANKGYIEKLEHSRPDSLEATTVINSVLDKLRKVDSSMSEYMIIRFADAPYLQSLLFFQQLIATIRLCFSLIRNNKPFIDQTAHIEDLIKPNRKSNNKH